MGNEAKYHKDKLVFESDNSINFFKALVDALDNVRVESNAMMEKPFEISLGELRNKNVFEGEIATLPNPTNSYINNVLDEKNSKKIHRPSQTIQIKDPRRKQRGIRYSNRTVCFRI